MFTFFSEVSELFRPVSATYLWGSIPLSGEGPCLSGATKLAADLFVVIPGSAELMELSATTPGMVKVTVRADSFIVLRQLLRNSSWALDLFLHFIATRAVVVEVDSVATPRMAPVVTPSTTEAILSPIRQAIFSTGSAVFRELPSATVLIADDTEDVPAAVFRETSVASRGTIKCVFYLP